MSSIGLPQTRVCSPSKVLCVGRAGLNWNFTTRVSKPKRTRQYVENSCLDILILAELEFARVRGGEKSTSLFFIGFPHQNFQPTESIHGDSVGLGRRFATQRAGDSGRLKEGRDLTGLILTVCDEDAARAFIRRRDNIRFRFRQTSMLQLGPDDPRGFFGVLGDVRRRFGNLVVGFFAPNLVDFGHVAYVEEL